MPSNWSQRPKSNQLAVIMVNGDCTTAERCRWSENPIAALDIVERGCHFVGQLSFAHRADNSTARVIRKDMHVPPWNVPARPAWLGTASTLPFASRSDCLALVRKSAADLPLSLARQFAPHGPNSS
jgi:hypothetical protein